MATAVGVSARSWPLFQRLGPPEGSCRDPLLQGREGLRGAPRPHRTGAEETGQLPGLPLSGRLHWAARGALGRFPRQGKGVPARPGWREAAVSHRQGQALNKGWGLFLLSRAQSSQEETEAWLGPEVTHWTARRLSLQRRADWSWNLRDTPRRLHGRPLVACVISWASGRARAPASHSNGPISGRVALHVPFHSTSPSPPLHPPGSPPRPPRTPIGRPAERPLPNFGPQLAGRERARRTPRAVRADVTGRGTARGGREGARPVGGYKRAAVRARPA
ncbi:hypothetical protein J1605_005940 [Eschrichtius robustus]|uniref:Uncharacterized protein n=1 Tax=Eschrichtius robustus TaxID=9764 RepID=A0AB34H5U3_ESCRO|nr:hypothetical protein J1605_005940 [Eschrichtius robustus]